VPTPTANDGTFDGLSRKVSENQINRGVGLQTWAVRISKGFYEDMDPLLPTPNTLDYTTLHKEENIDRKKAGYSNLRETIVREDFAQFATAISRWEKVLGRAAPAPTAPDGKDGEERLTSTFSEWLMGLPAGWATGLGLGRKVELMICGNGVVPQQAKRALQILSERID